MVYAPWAGAPLRGFGAAAQEPPRPRLHNHGTIGTMVDVRG